MPQGAWLKALEHLKAKEDFCLCRTFKASSESRKPRLERAEKYTGLSSSVRFDRERKEAGANCK
jgi:hypothetical protein